jgi:alkylation response protein AidB-like acyl-CoA dehydrogenase
MDRYAKVEGGAAVAIYVANDAAFAAAQGWVPAGGAAIGDIWDGTTFVRPPPPPAPVPSSITRRQLILGLLAAGWITPVEAEAAATGGAPPAALDAVLANLTEADALEARITWATMSVAERWHPLLVAIVAAGIATDAQVDNLFRASVAL